MSQHDLTIDNQGFPAFRSDLNNALQALGSTQSGTTAPSPTFANQLWYDTTNNILKIRNEDNDAWISLLTLNQTTDALQSVFGLIIGTDVQAYDADTAKTDVANTFTALQTFAGTSSNADLKTSNILEVVTVSATAATGTIAYDVTTQSVLYYTTNASGNFTVNFRGSSGTSLDTLMATGESLSVTFLVTNGSTAYYNSAVQVDGNTVTPKWQGGTAPTSGNASSIDSYTYVIIKTGSATFTVLAAQTKFA
jgi:hypothetical protein